MADVSTLRAASPVSVSEGTRCHQTDRTVEVGVTLTDHVNIVTLPRTRRLALYPLPFSDTQ